jgi:hypothetical protein
MRQLIGRLVLAVGLIGCSSGLEVIGDCRPERGIRPICGFHNPEDLALLDDSRTLVVSQFGSLDGSQAGSLALFDIVSESLRITFPSSGEPTTTGPVWGAEDCPGPPPVGFSPHGIDLAQRADGHWQLLVVNHGGREAVEFFEIVGQGATRAIEWRGCAVPPPEAYFNDVVTLPEGGFLVTHMMERDSPLLGMLKSSMGFDTGWVFEWQTDSGYQMVPGTEGAMPNGIEISPDGTEIFLNLYGAGQIARIARHSGELLGSAEIPAPDNLTWRDDGLLLVASHPAPLGDMMTCMRGIEEGSCPFEFQIVALDPQTMTGQPIFSNAGPPMGAGTVALQVGQELFIGTFAGDRIARVGL